MAELLRFEPTDFWYITLAGYGSKYPQLEWGGYRQSFVASDDVYGHRDVVRSDHDWWGIPGCKDLDRGTPRAARFRPRRPRGVRLVRSRSSRTTPSLSALETAVCTSTSRSTPSGAPSSTPIQTQWSTITGQETVSMDEHQHSRE